MWKYLKQQSLTIKEFLQFHFGIGKTVISRQQYEVDIIPNQAWGDIVEIRIRGIQKLEKSNKLKEKLQKLLDQIKVKRASLPPGVFTNE